MRHVGTRFGSLGDGRPDGDGAPAAAPAPGRPESTESIAEKATHRPMIAGVEYGLVPSVPSERRSTTAVVDAATRRQLQKAKKTPPMTSKTRRLGECVIRLDCLGLDDVPDAVFTKVTLRRLSLRLNRIGCLDPRIGNLVNLSHLNVSGNNVRCFPDEIGALKNLRDLNAASNLLEAIPKAVIALPRLRLLDVSDNPLGDAVLGGTGTYRQLVDGAIENAVNSMASTRARQHPRHTPMWSGHRERVMEAATDEIIGSLGSRTHRPGEREAIRRMRLARHNCRINGMRETLKIAADMGGGGKLLMRERELVEALLSVIEDLRVATRDEDVDALMCSMRKIDDFARDGVIHPSAVESSQAIRQPKAKMKELMSRQSFNEWTQQKRANERLLTLESPVPRCQSSMLPSV